MKKTVTGFCLALFFSPQIINCVSMIIFCRERILSVWRWEGICPILDDLLAVVGAGYFLTTTFFSLCLKYRYMNARVNATVSMITYLSDAAPAVRWSPYLTRLMS